KAPEEEIARALVRALEKVLQAETVPARNATQCGNYRDISLFGAQEYAKEVRQGLLSKYA
ncbi:MAG TPA: S-ribosylhomocysteine lyase, partial [Firmicutes bacterium]|nr:S-ribosylhomocysteine lyase [Bacillota bacterium]